jgi:two-component system response regulator GlrR
MEKFERNYLIELLNRCNGNISEVARVAQSNRMTVYRMIKNYHISTRKYTRK